MIILFPAEPCIQAVSTVRLAQAIDEMKAIIERITKEIASRTQRVTRFGFYDPNVYGFRHYETWEEAADAAEQIFGSPDDRYRVHKVYV
jgi:trimethylamine:corrinoid methyltransferase-like protein